jgi:hypothetical protein
MAAYHVARKIKDENQIGRLDITAFLDSRVEFHTHRARMRRVRNVRLQHAKTVIHGGDPDRKLGKEMLTDQEVHDGFELVGIRNLGFDVPKSLKRHCRATEQARRDELFERRWLFETGKGWNFEETHAERSQKAIAPTFTLRGQYGKASLCNLDPLLQFGHGRGLQHFAAERTRQNLRGATKNGDGEVKENNRGINIHLQFTLGFHLLKDPVRPRQHVRRDRQTDLLGRFQIDDEVEFLRLFYR